MGGFVYTALLQKMTNYNSDLLKRSDNWGMPWVTLGHFDIMYVYPLSHNQGSFFQILQENNEEIKMKRNSSKYLHPLYLISDTNAESFWADNNSYMAIMRIHFTVSTNALSLFDTVKADLEDNILKGKECDFRFFRTIELSDMILAVRAQKLSTVVSVALNLRQCSHIGKVYTYCAIRGDVIQTPDRIPGLWNKTDEIALASVRFSVRNFEQAMQQVKVIQQKIDEDDACIITGVDDLLVNAQNVPVRHLVDLYHWWFVMSDPKQTAQAFSDITTRVGISAHDFPDPTDDGDSQNGLLQPICDELVDLCVCISSRYNQWESKQNQSVCEWVSLLPELANTLVRMSSMPMLDEFIYLMLPGVRAFLQNIKEKLFQLSKEDSAVCREFVDNWISLMEHVMRVEGQLAHHPELRPTLYDIPIVMLEYTLAFLWQVTKIFQERDETGNLQSRSTAFLLVPRLGFRIKAQELFSPCAAEENPGLVLVTIPLQSLYRPEEVQWNLVHEASHFIGEHCRHRKERLIYFVRSIAPIIAKKVYGTSCRSLRSAIADRLMVHLSGTSEVTMEIIVHKVYKWLNDMASTEDKKENALYCDILRDAMKHHGVPNATERIPLGNITPLRAKSAETIACIDTVQKLYREVYADLCMLVLLPISSEKYVNSILDEIEISKKSYEEMAIRICTVLNVIGQRIPNCLIANRSLELLEYVNKVIKEETKEMRFHPEVTRQMKEYLTICYKSLKEQLSQASMRQIAEKIEEMYINTSSDQSKTPDHFNYTLLLKSIDDYRAEIIGYETLCSPNLNSATQMRT